MNEKSSEFVELHKWDDVVWIANIHLTDCIVVASLIQILTSAKTSQQQFNMWNI